MAMDSRQDSAVELQQPESGAEVGADDGELLPRTDRGRRAYIVLVGCALQQIPVWGFQQAFGAVQQYLVSHGSIHGDRHTVGVVGTTMTGVIYISMPFVSAFLTRYRSLCRMCSIVGAILTAASLVAAAFSTEVWHLICALGILHGLGAALLYTSTMMILNTWFIDRKGLAFSITLSTKAATGTVTPLVFSQLLNGLGFKYTFVIWAGVALAVSIPAGLFLHPRASTQTLSSNLATSRRVPFSLLKSRTAWSFILATTIFSAGYGLPQTYLATYANQVLKLSTPLSSSMLAMLSAPSVPASIAFGILSDGNAKILGRRINAHAATTIAGLGSAIPVFLLWGFSANVAVLIVFSIIYGFFAGGFSSIFSGVMKEVARERTSDEESDTGLVFGLLNGGRGVGFVVGGLIGAKLLGDNPVGFSSGATYGYGSSYAALIIFTGVTSVFGGSSLLWKVSSLFR